MSVLTVEAEVGDGQIRLPEHLRLPDRTKVYVVIPGVEATNVARVVSPRSARPEQASDFALEVVEAEPDAGV
jgi:hypothetical protein